MEFGTEKNAASKAGTIKAPPPMPNRAISNPVMTPIKEKIKKCMGLLYSS